MNKNVKFTYGGGVLYNKNVKAFTLIELLAVIVILAIIALIATPIILGVINDSKEKAFRLSLNNIVHAYELYTTQNNIEEGKLVDIKDLPLDSKNITGKVTTNKDGKVELKQVTDGTFSAEGTLKNLTVIKGPVDKLVEHKLDVKININFYSTKIEATVDLVGEGIPKKYVYEIIGTDKNETITKEVGKDETPESHTFDNLTIGEEYTVKVSVTNKSGKTTKESTKTGKTIDPKPEIDLQATGKTSGIYMTSGKVIITYPSSEYKNYYRWDDGDFIPVTGDKIEIEAKNGIITAIVIDGEDPETAETVNQAVETITTIDTEGPTITKIKKSGLKVTIEATDTLSGVKDYSCNGGTSWQASNICEFSEEGTYIIKVRDNLLNETTTNVIAQLFDENNGAEPVLNNLTPVKYDGTNWVVVSSTDPSWYDYSNQQWANAVLLKSGVTKIAGDTVTVEGSDTVTEAVAMFVWIPRYEYKIEGTYGTHYNSDGTKKSNGTAALPGEIKVNFISKDEVYEGTNSEGYRIHPAFTFGTQELDGIWMGKFETSHTTLSSSTTNNNLGCSDNNCTNADGLRILPSVKSLRYNNVSNFFYVAQSMGNRRNIDGDLHVARNSEWGAAAYLSQSKYGKYGNASYTGAEKQVRINNCQNFITGIGANSQNEAKSTTTCTISTNGYTKAKGQAASTTGNITGIYDMSGGAYDLVMGVLADSRGNPRSGRDSSLNSGFTGALDSGTYTGIPFPDSKYYDLYTTTDKTTACNSGICYGHALSETLGWYGDQTGFITSTSPWLLYEYYSATTNAGVFGTNWSNGSAQSHVSFRVVLTQS